MILRVAVAAIVLLACAIAWTPLRFILSVAPLDKAGVTVQHASGTVWKGRLEQVTLRGENMGSFDLQTFASDIFTGKIRTAFRSDGPIVSGIVGVSGGGLNATRLFGRVPLNRLTLAAPREAFAGFEQAAVALTPNGRQCRSASGRVRIDAMPDYGLGAFEGPIGCEGGDIIARLADAGGQTDLTARIDLDGPAGRLLTAQSGNPQVQAALQLVGLAPPPEAAPAPAAETAPGASQ